MREKLALSKCPFEERHFVVQQCTDNVAGAFDPAVGIRLCVGNIYSRRHMEETMAHNLIKAWDHW